MARLGAAPRTQGVTVVQHVSSGELEPLLMTGLLEGIALRELPFGPAPKPGRRCVIYPAACMRAKSKRGHSRVGASSLAANCARLDGGLERCDIIKNRAETALTASTLRD